MPSLSIRRDVMFSGRPGGELLPAPAPPPPPPLWYTLRRTPEATASTSVACAWCGRMDDSDWHVTSGRKNYQGQILGMDWTNKSTG